MRRFVVALCSVFAVAATGVVGYALAGPATRQATTVTDVTVHAGEYYFNLSTITAPTGTVNFHVINDGEVGHDFSIANQRTPILEKGQTATLTVNFTTAGKYGFICTLGEHAVYGMQGEFTVTGGTTTTVIGGTTITNTVTTPPPLPLKGTVNVNLKEFKIILTQRKKVRVKKGKKFVFQLKNVVVKSVPKGRIKFVVKNTGALPHNFVEVGGTQGTRVLAKGQSQTVTWSFPAKGSVRYECSITGHAAAGMKGTLKVV